MRSETMPPIKIQTDAEYLHFFSELEKSKILGITNELRSDGIGAQATAIASVQLFCQESGIKYYHRPFANVMFPDGKPDWPGRWERFFNLGMGEDLLPDSVKIMTPLEWLTKGKPEDVVIAVNHCYSYIQQGHTADKLEIIRPALRRKYYAGSPKPFVNEKKYVAIHVRRGDVKADNRYAVRFTSNEDVIFRVSRLLGGNIGKDEIHIFSQGSREDFEAFQSLGNVRLFLDTDPFETFHRMVHADLLIAGKSTFSYLAGLLSENAVRAESWYHKPLTSWYFDDQRLEYEGTEEVTKRPAEVLAKLDAKPELVARSALLQWIRAQALMRCHRKNSYDALEDVANNGSMYSKAAAKTLCSILIADKTDAERLTRIEKLIADNFT